MGKKQKPKPTKRIYNPITRSYFVVRTEDTKEGKKGSIVGKWHPPKKTIGQRDSCGTHIKSINKIKL